MKTKFNDNVFETSDLSQIQNKYLSERVLRSWMEDFVDEDSGEVVSIQRHEVLFEKGILLDSHTISELNFYFNSGDIKSVKVGEVQRVGLSTKGFTSVYVVSVVSFKKKLNFYLYANSIQNAIDISLDYLEQKLLGPFSFKSVKELSYSTLITEIEDDSEDEDNSEDEKDFYSICMQIIQDEFDSSQMFILRSKNAEDAKKIIEKYLIQNLSEDKKDIPLEITLLSAKIISCEDVIDYQFSKEYIDNETLGCN